MQERRPDPQPRPEAPPRTRPRPAEPPPRKLSEREEDRRAKERFDGEGGDQPQHGEKTEPPVPPPAARTKKRGDRP